MSWAHCKAIMVSASFSFRLFFLTLRFLFFSFCMNCSEINYMERKQTLGAKFGIALATTTLSSDTREKNRRKTCVPRLVHLSLFGSPSVFLFSFFLSSADRADHRSRRDHRKRGRGLFPASLVLAILYLSMHFLQGMLFVRSVRAIRVISGATSSARGRELQTRPENTSVNKKACPRDRHGALVNKHTPFALPAVVKFSRTASLSSRAALAADVWLTD